MVWAILCLCFPALIDLKSDYAALWAISDFPHFNFSLTELVPLTSIAKLYRYFRGKISDSLYSFVPPFQTSWNCHAT